MWQYSTFSNMRRSSAVMCYLCCDMFLKYSNLILRLGKLVCVLCTRCMKLTHYRDGMSVCYVVEANEQISIAFVAMNV
jgi:hypothetical protein